MKRNETRPTGLPDRTVELLFMEWTMCEAPLAILIEDPQSGSELVSCVITLSVWLAVLLYIHSVVCKFDWSTIFMSFLTRWTLSCSPIIAWIFFWFVMLPLFRFFITLQSMFACLYSVFKVPAADLSAVIISFGNDRVEMVRFELMTPCLQGRCSPNWATPPKIEMNLCFVSVSGVIFVNNSSRVELLYIKCPAATCSPMQSPA